MAVGTRAGRSNLNGNQVYTTLAQRDAHPLHARNEEVQEFYVIETGKTYQLKGGVDNANWEEVKSVPTFPSPFKVKQAMPIGNVAHDGTIEGFLRAGFAPFLLPNIALSATPATIEVGRNVNISCSGSLDARGESETTFNTLRLVRDTVLKKEQASGNSLSFAEIINFTSEVSSAFTFSSRWSGGGYTDQSLSITRSVSGKYPYWYGSSLDGSLLAATVNPAVRANRTMLNATFFNLVVNNASGAYIYVVIPSARSISSISDNNDNGAAVPLSTFQLMGTGTMTVTETDGIDVAYGYSVKVYRTSALGAATFNWRINL